MSNFDMLIYTLNLKNRKLLFLADFIKELKSAWDEPK